MAGSRGGKRGKPQVGESHIEKAASVSTEAALELVPEAGIEPARLSARDFLTTSAFAAVLLTQGVRGLEHAFTIALQP